MKSDYSMNFSIQMITMQALEHFVTWMHQGEVITNILGKIEFSTDNENAGKNAQFQL